MRAPRLGHGADDGVLVVGQARRADDDIGPVIQRRHDIAPGDVGLGVFEEDVAGEVERFLGRAVDGT